MTTGEDIIKFAQHLGTELLPWQKDVVRKLWPIRMSCLEDKDSEGYRNWRLMGGHVKVFLNGKLISGVLAADPLRGTVTVHKRWGNGRIKIFNRGNEQFAGTKKLQGRVHIVPSSPGEFQEMYKDPTP